MNTTLTWSGAALLGLLGATGCSSSTGTADDLARAVVSSLAAGDFDGYLADTVVSTAQGLEVCPAAKSFTVDVAAFRDHFDSCRKDFDFKGATVTAISPKLQTTAAGDKDCGNTEPVNAADSIEVTVSTDAGKYKFQIGDSVETPEGWRQLKHLSCSGDTPKCDAYVLAVQSCCDQPSADKSQCDPLVEAAKAAQDLAAQLETDCGTDAFSCPFN